MGGRFRETSARMRTTEKSKPIEERKTKEKEYDTIAFHGNAQATGPGAR
jgi:hypothetical protein